MIESRITKIEKILLGIIEFEIITATFASAIWFTSFISKVIK